MFSKTQKVYFGHIDRAGIVYHPHFVDYFNQAYEDFLEDLGFDEKNLQRDLGVRVPVANVDVDFHKPMRAGDRLEIEVRVEHLGTSSICFDFEANDRDGDCVVDGKVIRVTVDDNFEPTGIPGKLREALEPHRIEDG